MASWKDGAAYAPVERPDGFATPVADPLPVGAPYTVPTPGPMAQPRDFESAHQEPLAQLGRTDEANRDPRQGFAVASMALTNAPRGAKVRDPRQAFALTSSHVAAGGPPPPTGEPLAGPNLTPPGYPAAPPQSWPPPAAYPVPNPSGPGPQAPQGYPQQWAPPSGAPRRAQPDSTRTMAWIGAAFAGVGVLLAPATPFLLIIAGVFGLRSVNRTGYLGIGSAMVGTASVVYQLVTGTLGQGIFLISLLSFVAMVWFIIGALIRS